ncbi:hypothetical protein AB0D08_22110 [Kitasatospora sp. NPDC048540]|uniref:hypothetical protein n=1 Tax=Kitasatospora sp. NPDC048540 TaxID=3155634 RepID=UPI0033CD8AA0
MDIATGGAVETGAGRVTCVGTVLGRDLARDPAAWLAPVAVGGRHDLPGSATGTTGTAPDGRWVHVVHNWSWQPAEVRTPEGLDDALDGRALDQGARVRLGAWDGRVFTSRRPATAVHVSRPWSDAPREVTAIYPMSLVRPPRRASSCTTRKYCRPLR